VAEPLTSERIREALGQVRYPGFTRDLVSFGMVEHVSVCDGSVKVRLVVATREPGVPARLRRDQTQHVELTRDLAGKLNEAYGPVFKLPRASILEDVAVVPGTDGQKMSRGYGNTIELGRTGDALRKRVMAIVTNSAAVAKGRLFEALQDYFAPFRARRDALARDPAAADRLLQNGAEQARAVAAQTMARVRLAVGID
jgi:tryptophanyl-tRNA synthetase